MKEILKQKSGITLIALVITIIVLLILAGVSIAMLTGDNGILTQAQNAKNKTEQASATERIQLAVMATSMNNNGYTEILDTDSFKQELQNQFGSEEVNATPNGDGSFIVTVSDRKYYVNDDKTVISNDNIIEIGTEEELKSFRDDVNSGNSYEGKVVLLTSDITLSENWEPIGYYSEETEDVHYLDVPVNKPFKGIFDGCNHTINNLQINTEKGYQGLFGLVIDGSIRNITIGEESSVTAGDKSGAIIGCLYGFSGNVYNCVNYAKVNSYENASGGIVGQLLGQHTVSNCKNYGEITGSGGIVGGSNGISDWPEFINYYNEIINCGNYGKVIKSSSNGKCGGIVGYFKGNIVNCCNKAEITGTELYVSGIVAALEGNVKNCYNTGNIIGQNIVSGIIGQAGEDWMGANLINCYSIGQIEGIMNMGDIVGLKSNFIKEQINCYTKADTFTAADLGDAFVDDKENENAGYPILSWE